jgi:hypothetical protein
MKTGKSAQALSVVAAALFSALFATGAAATAFDFESGLAGWTSVGESKIGTSGAQGDITVSPNGGNFGYATTDGGDTSFMGTNGSMLYSPVFSANAGDELQLFLNYVTSDGSSFSDYAWAALTDASFNPIAILFTAKTNSNGDTVPGFGLDPIDAILTPANVPIQAGSGSGGGPIWEFLGTSSGACYNSSACGFTGWIQSDYTFAEAGDYIIEFGVINWGDTNYDSGLLFDGITITGGDANSVPEPASLALLGLGLAGLGALRRRA